jgi:hypothetical protein
MSNVKNIQEIDEKFKFIASSKLIVQSYQQQQQ